MSRRRPEERGEEGLTLVELVLAAGLLSMLMVAVFNLLDSFLGMWEKSETRRQLVEEASGIGELLATDLSALEAGPRGDFLAEWVFFDTDGEGGADTMWPRIRMVRHASPAELDRMFAGQALGPQDTQGLIEVVWAILPARPVHSNPDLRAEALAWRGERLLRPSQSDDPSIFEDEFLSRAGFPRPGATNEVSGGILWFGMQFATQTSILNDGWSIGDGLQDCATSWDAWGKGRPNADRTEWNLPGRGMPTARTSPILPRRVRIELEIEREKDLKKRTRLSRFTSTEERTLQLDHKGRVPDVGAFVRVDAEWMQITTVTGRQVGVRRGQRATEATTHESGALVHWGFPLVREVPIAQHQEDWNL